MFNSIKTIKTSCQLNQLNKNLKINMSPNKVQSKCV